MIIGIMQKMGYFVLLTFWSGALLLTSAGGLPGSVSCSLGPTVEISTTFTISVLCNKDREHALLSLFEIPEF